MNETAHLSSNPSRNPSLSSALAWLRNAWGHRPPTEQEQLAKAYRRLLESRDGQRIVADLARYTNVLNSSYAPGDAHQTLFNEGQRDVYLHIMGMARLSDDELLSLIQQA